MKQTKPMTEKQKLCPTRELLDRLGDKWSVLLIIALAKAPEKKHRFSVLLKNIDGISQRMLTRTLRYLERDGFINRHFYPEIPPKVEYELTPLGESIFKIMLELKMWVENNWEIIYDARTNFDLKYNS
ncbi:MAG: helix-turn-helix transcriptional regulator [Legionellales bacterium]|nr:helix-turn-helix transcriptional regulator [Legionellales bacterium]